MYPVLVKHLQFPQLTLESWSEFNLFNLLNHFDALSCFHLFLSLYGGKMSKKHLDLNSSKLQ